MIAISLCPHTSNIADRCVPRSSGQKIVSRSNHYGVTRIFPCPRVRRSQFDSISTGPLGRRILGRRDFCGARRSSVAIQEIPMLMPNQSPQPQSLSSAFLFAVQPRRITRPTESKPDLLAYPLKSSALRQLLMVLLQFHWCEEGATHIADYRLIIDRAP